MSELQRYTLGEEAFRQMPVGVVIFIGFRAGYTYTGLAGHIVALGDGVEVPNDSPPYMLYEADKPPRSLPRIDEEVGALIKAYAFKTLASSEKLGLPAGVLAWSDEDWQTMFDRFNSSAEPNWATT